MQNSINISFGSKNLIEFMQDEKNTILEKHNPCGYRVLAQDIDDYICNIEKDSNLSQTKIKRKIGAGSSAVVYETEDGDVLKLTRYRHYPLFRQQEDFDVPIKKQGKAGRIHYYLEEKLYQHNLNEGFVRIIKGMIADKGYIPWDIGDFDTNQIGISKDGKIYLLDPECARFKTIFHALWSRVKRTNLFGKFLFPLIGR